MKENHIEFLPGELINSPSISTFTDSEISFRPQAKLEEIAPGTPMIKFGPFGPETVFRADGSKTILHTRRVYLCKSTVMMALSWK